MLTFCAKNFEKSKKIELSKSNQVFDIATPKKYFTVRNEPLKLLTPLNFIKYMQ